jgi:hypothetical protein
MISLLLWLFHKRFLTSSKPDYEKKCNIMLDEDITCTLKYLLAPKKEI